MDRQSQPHDYPSAAAMSYAQQQRPPPSQQFGFQQQPPPQQYAPPPHFMPSHPSVQQFPYPHHLQQPHAPPPPPHPHFMPQQQPPPPFGPHFNAPLHAPPFPAGYDTPPPPAPPPPDPELQKRIDKLVEYITKNGPEFEVMIREKQQDNPGYSFLFGGEGNNYYRYKLWLATHPPPGGPYNAPFAAGIHPPLMNAAAMHQQHFAPFFDPHHQHLMNVPPRPDFDSAKQFKGMSGALPHEIVMELNNVLNGLNGTKESIKGAKIWFMQRAPFAPALAEVLRERVFALDDSERQLHIVYLVNDILFDSLQRRMNPRELDNEALAFKPVLGSILARVYHNPQNKDENQSRLQKILQFWGSKEVYDQDTIYGFEGEMIGGPTASSFSGPSKDVSSDSVGPAGYPQQIGNHGASQWQPDRQGLPDQDRPDKHMPAVMPPSLGNQQFIPNSVPPGSFPGPIPINSAAPPVNQQPAPHLLQTPVNTAEKLPPYPLFPPGLIPGMVKKMQIGSGVPYSPMSPLDIPTIIPPSNVSPSEILERVSKFFKEIGEVNPSEGPMKAHSDDDDDEYERRDSPVRKGGACIPPPPNLQVDPETGTYADGSVERKPGSSSSGRLGLGATADPNEASQYDDVYTSYRKQRSSTYHSSMSARAALK